MQSDLIGLEISKGELRRLTGFDPDDVFRPSIFKDKKKRLGFLLNEGVVAVALTPIVVGFIYAFMILPTIGSSIPLGLILLILVPIGVIVGRWIWRKSTCPQLLTKLLDEVDQYHTIVKAVHLNDELSAVASSQVESEVVTSRELRVKVVEALQLIREDLVRALKTERVLRDNKNLLANNQELLTNNLVKLQALQVNNQASEYARLLNQSLQIAVDVQAELKKIQSN